MATYMVGDLVSRKEDKDCIGLVIEAVENPDFDPEDEDMEDNYIVIRWANGDQEQVIFWGNLEEVYWLPIVGDDK